MHKALIVMDEVFVDQVYPLELRKRISEHIDLISKPITTKALINDPKIINDVDFIFSSWGGPNLDEALLEHAPKLKVIFYGAGSIKKIATDASWQKKIRITSSALANAVPVAEYTLACTIMGLKNSFKMRNNIIKNKSFPKPGTRDIKGNFNATIGLISLGAISRHLIKLYKNFDYYIIAYDPFVSESEAKQLGVTLVSLDEVFSKADVVSLHTPLLDSTKGYIGKKHFKLMKENAVFINTARGALIKEDEMIAFLEERQDITAYLDVVYPEPPVEDSKLYTLENVYLTPHIAGSEGEEIARLGYFMYEELLSYLKDETLKHEITQEMFERMA